MDRGHQLLPHTADVIADAWGPDVEACIEEAVAALVDVYAEERSIAVRDRLSVGVAQGPLSDMLLAALDEVIFVLDTSPTVPVGARAHRRGDGGLDIELQLASRADVEPTGAVPKAISRSGLRMERTGDQVRCSFLIDV